MLPCINNSCQGPNGNRLSGSVNNISFEFPTSTSILSDYYNHVNNGRVYGENFPDEPPFRFDFTAENLSVALQMTSRRTEVKMLEFNSTIELVLQGTNLVAGNDHPIHIHGYNFYVVGLGLGNFDKPKDSLRYNLVVPPLDSTITVPKNGWAAIRFKAINPGMRTFFSSSFSVIILVTSKIYRRSCFHVILTVSRLFICNIIKI